MGDVGRGDDSADPAGVFSSRGKPIKEIVRDVKVSRNTVRKREYVQVLRLGAHDYSCEGATGKPTHAPEGEAIQ